MLKDLKLLNWRQRPVSVERLFRLGAAILQARFFRSCVRFLLL